jgi:phosphatidylglycerophosphatase A
MMKRKIAWTLATWFGCGLNPIGPGTTGTLGALPLYFLVRSIGGNTLVLITAILITFIGVWASNIVVRETKEKDPQRIVIDEVAGVLIALAAAPPTILGVITAVVLFRIFDMTKPFPARRLEHLKEGWGVVMDDVAAGLWAAAIVLFVF